MKKLGYIITLLSTLSVFSSFVNAGTSIKRPPVVIEKKSQIGVKKHPIKEGQSVRRPPVLRAKWNNFF